MNWISNWIQGIIIAVIIGTIIEMLLPEGNCKKYVKVVIGVYILFSIISPVITKVTGSEFRVSDIYDINSYIEASTKSTQDYAEISLLDELKMENIQDALVNGTVKIKNLTTGKEFEAKVDLTDKEIEVIKVGGRLNYVKHNS